MYLDLLSLIVAVLPVFIIGLYIYKKDRVKESSKLLFKLFIFGVFSCVPAAYFGSIFGFFFPEMEDMNYIQLLLYVLLVISFVEELCKWFFTYKLTYNHDEFDSSYDMVVYSVFIALGFACFENILYVKEYGIFTGILRAILAVPGHACDGILMGIYLGLAKLYEVNGKLKKAKKYKILSIVIPIIIHCVYDFCLLSGIKILILLFSLFVVFVDVVCFKKVKEMSLNSIKFKYKNRFCTVCGMKLNGNYCSQCGNKNF